MKKKSFITLISSFLAVLFVLSSAVVGISAKQSEVVGSGDPEKVAYLREPFMHKSELYSCFYYPSGARTGGWIAGNMSALLPSPNITLTEVKSKPLYWKIDDGTTPYSVYLYRGDSTGTAFIEGEGDAPLYGYYYWTDADTVYLPQNCYKLIARRDSADYKYLETVDLSGFDTSHVTNMNYMFASCPKLSTIIWGDNLNTANVTDMSGMFESCSGITTLDLSSFDTSNVTNMDTMFRRCYALSELNISSFDTSKVNSMWAMFMNCSSLTSLDLSSFNTNNVTNMSGMFYCDGYYQYTKSHLTRIIFGDSFTTNNVTNMNYMFYRCSEITTLDLSSFDTSSVATMDSMFEDCTKLEKIYSNTFDVSSITNTNISMFSNCLAIDGGNGTTYDKNQTRISYARIDGENGLPGYFHNPEELISGPGTQATVNPAQMNSTMATTVKILPAPSGMTIEDVQSIPNVSKVDTNDTKSSIYTWTDDNDFTYYWTNAETLYLPEDSSELFSNDSTVKEIDLSGMDASNVTDTSNMFANDTNLKTIIMPNLDTDNVTNSDNMFLNCKKLVGGDGTAYDEDHVDKEYARLDGENGRKGYFSSSGSIRQTPDNLAMVTLTTEAPTFNVTVPTILPVAVDSNNNVVTATNAKISNNGNGAVQITDCTLDTSGSNWSIVPFDTDFRSVPVNSKQYGFKLNGVEAAVNGGLYAADQFSVINGKADSDTLDYTANVAIQSSSANAVNIGTVIFTVAYYTAA